MVDHLTVRLDNMFSSELITLEYSHWSTFLQKSFCISLGKHLNLEDLVSSATTLQREDSREDTMMQSVSAKNVS